VTKIPSPTFKSIREAKADPETILVRQDEEQPKGAQIAFVNGHTHAAETLTQEQIMSRMLGIMEKMVDKNPSAAGQQPQIMPMPMPITPEQGALVAITLLDERYQTTLKQIAVEKANGSVAAVVAGILTRVADLDSLSDFAFNEQWANAINQTPYPQQSLGLPQGFVQPHQNICEYCHHPFKPMFQSNRQRFCCNACGNLAQGRTDEPLPHRADCTTEPGKELTRIMRIANKQAEATA
jgi:hypothetical protein